MFKRIALAVIMTILVGITLIAPASPVYANVQTNKNETPVNIPMTEKEVRNALKKRGLSDEEVEKVMKRPTDENHVEANASSYVYFNQSCGYYAYDYYYTNQGYFNHWFGTTTGSYVNDYYGYDSRAGGGWWYSTAPAGSYSYAGIIGNSPVGHGNYGCGR